MAKYNLQNKKMNISKKKLLIPLAFITLVLIGSITVFRGNDDRSTLDISTDTAGLKGVDLNASTKEDEQLVNTHKEDLSKKVSDSTQESSNTSGQKTVVPILTDAAQYGEQVEVRAYVPGVIENGGTCEIRFSNGDVKLNKTASALKDATTTRCTNITIAKSEFTAAGEWIVVVSYTSPTATGSSQPRKLEIQ